MQKNWPKGHLPKLLVECLQLVEDKNIIVQLLTHKYVDHLVERDIQTHETHFIVDISFDNSSFILIMWNPFIPHGSI